MTTSPTALARRSSLARRSGGAAAIVGAAVAFGSVVRAHVDLADLAMIHLAAIVVVGALLGRGPALLAAVLAVGAFDFFFVPPLHTLVVHELRHVLTFAVMLAAGVLTSSATERIRRQTQDLRVREARLSALYGLARALAGARDATEIGAATRAHASLALSGECEIVRPGEHRPAREGEIAIPVTAGARALGTFVVRPRDPRRFEHADERQVLESFVAAIALALERAELDAEAQRAQLRAETEEMRSSLLSSVSHDLRTPIATITGAATSLSSSPELSAEVRDELAVAIRDEALRLERLVGKLLDMTRVESGALEVNREWVPLEELVGAALTRLEGRLSEHRVATELPIELAWIPVDPVLLEQVLVNVLENAARHTPPGTRIVIGARVTAAAIAIEIADDGPGLPPGCEARVFERFFRGTTDRSGVGLGLAICRGIVHAHGGTIVARNVERGGASFVIELPMVGSPPPMADEPPMPDEPAIAEERPSADRLPNEDRTPSADPTAFAEAPSAREAHAGSAR